MSIEDIDSGEELWTTLLERSVKAGSEYILMPCSAMGEEKAIALAKKLDISVMVHGDDYAFTTTKEATQALLAKTRH